MSEPQRLGEVLPGVMTEIDRRIEQRKQKDRVRSAVKDYHKSRRRWPKKHEQHKDRIDCAKLLLEKDIPAESPLNYTIWH
jgi:hypothetical protein